MGDYTDLVERYIATWNETDAERRRALIARTFTENASYIVAREERLSAGF